MKISELSALLSKVQQIAGDVDVVLKHAESEAETVITDLGIHLSPQSGSTGSTLEIAHDTAPPPAPEPTPPAEGPPAATGDEPPAS